MEYLVARTLPGLQDQRQREGGRTLGSKQACFTRAGVLYSEGDPRTLAIKGPGHSTDN